MFNASPEIPSAQRIWFFFGTFQQPVQTMLSILRDHSGRIVNL